MFYFGWVLFFAIAVRNFLTLYHIPHLALGAEMATDYTDRNALFSNGLFFSALAGYGFYFFTLTFYFPPSAELPNGMYNADGYALLSATAGIIAFCAIVLCVWGTRREIPNLSKAAPSAENLSLKRIYGELKVAFSSQSYRSVFSD